MFSHTFRPRFRDTDRVGHVNNAVFATYLEIGRIEWLRHVRNQGEKFNIQFIIARIEVDYISPIYLQSEVKVEVWVDKIGDKSWTFAYRLSDDITGVEYGRGKSVQVAFNYDANKSVPITTEVRELLQKYVSH